MNGTGRMNRSRAMNRLISAPILAMVVMLFASSAALLAQQPTFHDDLLDHLAGKWVLQGVIAGKKTTHDVTATWVLNHQYLEFKEVSREFNTDENPAYTATVYIGWDQAASQYVCVWLDSYGGMSTQSLGHAKRSGNTIPFVFQDANDAGKDHTTFAYDSAANTWTLNIDTEADGKVSPFARTTLSAAPTK